MASAQVLICAIHVGDDDRDVLEPRVVALRVRRRRPPARREELQQLDALVAERKRSGREAHAEDTVEPRVVFIRNFCPRDLLEAEHVGVERHRAIKVVHGDADGVDGGDDCCRARASACEGRAMKFSSTTNVSAQRRSTRAAGEW